AFALPPDDRPAQPDRHGTDEAFAWLDRGPVHRVDVVLPGAGVAPEDVRLAVAVVVAGRHDLPVQIGHGAQEPFAWFDRGAGHRVDVVLPGRAVAPQDVGHAVAVEVAHTGNLPVLVGHRPQEPFARLDRQPVDRIEVVLPGGVVAPQDV